MTLADDLITYLGAQWTVVAACPKPAMFNGNQVKPQPSQRPPVLFVSNGPAAVDPHSFNQAGVQTTPFSIHGTAVTNTDALYQLNEVKKIINGRAVTGGWMEITSIADGEGPRGDQFLLEGNEVMWRVYTTFR